MRKNLVEEKLKLLGNTFIDSQFSSAPLIRMFCQKTLCLKIKKIHHKTLGIIHQSNVTYCDLLECNCSTSFHQRYLQFLLMGIYKSTVTTKPIIMQHIFREREAPYNLKRVQCFSFHLQVQQLMGKALTISQYTNSLHSFMAH